MTALTIATGIDQPNCRLDDSFPLGSCSTLSLQERHRSYDILKRYRELIFLEINALSSSREIFPALMREARRVLSDEDIPLAIHQEIRSIFDRARSDLRKLFSGRPLAELDDEAIAKLMIEDTKALSLNVLPTTEYPSLPTKFIPMDELKRCGLEKFLPGLVLPEGQVGYKGGIARIALKLLVSNQCPDFNPKLLDAELPLADKDAIFGPDMKGDMWSLAQQMGVDHDGIEDLEDFDIGKYFATRDLDINQCALTAEGLHYTDEAFNSARDDLIHANFRNNNLFGVDSFFINDVRYFSASSLYRLVKIVSDGKASAFEIPRYNLQVNLGIYWLVLIRKAIGKEDQAQIIQRIYDCAVKMGQADAPTAVHFMGELMAAYPHFDFKTQSTQGVAKWIATKYVAAVHRHLKQKFGLHPSGERYPFDNDEIVVIRPNDPNSSSFDPINAYVAELVA